MYHERKVFQDFIFWRWWSDCCILQLLCQIIKYCRLWWLESQEYFQVFQFLIKLSQCELLDWLSLNWSICYINSIYCYWIDWRFRFVGCYCCTLYCPTCPEYWASSNGFSCSICNYCNYSTFFPQRNFQG